MNSKHELIFVSLIFKVCTAPYIYPPPPYVCSFLIYLLLLPLLSSLCLFFSIFHFYFNIRTQNTEMHVLKQFFKVPKVYKIRT